MKGNKAIDRLMMQIKDHIKENTREENHTNRVYEKIWRWYDAEIRRRDFVRR